MSGTHDIKQEIKKYWKVFTALLVLTVVTVAISYLKFGLAVAIIVALTIALVKGSLVACFFMHLISERKLVYVILGFVVFFFLAMMLLIYASHFNLPEGVQIVS
ncbi:MAG: cytochrome C oxidase subunit IV family protein [Candidatus Omnitrophica bacterium]|nr:cytochrome C oxidase subunit IV family protein [Candidatus Omnitrophota bacterium]